MSEYLNIEADRDNKHTCTKASYSFADESLDRCHAKDFIQVGDVADLMMRFAINIDVEPAIEEPGLLDAVRSGQAPAYEI